MIINVLNILKMRGWIDDIDVLLEKFDNFFSIKIIENGEGILLWIVW